MSAVALTGADFLREHLRARLTLVMLVTIPALFVVASASALSEFATALGGSVGGGSASALGAGWAAAFLSGALGFFQVASSRDADRRLALAGMGPTRVATARILASVLLGLLITIVAFLTLWLSTEIGRPAHAFAAILVFSLIYIGIGTLVGSLISEPLEGSLTVAFVFLIDVFSGPGMSDGGGLAQIMPTRKAADVLIAAGAGQGSPRGDWIAVGLTAAGALALAAIAFWLSARPRSG
ncbi:MAG: ABC transporter permease [Solirubrobacterales bacterium]|nr:ABC transporter permease [Solirubrobacterales bacterium]